MLLLFYLLSYLSFQEPFQVKVSSEALLIMDLVRIKFYLSKRDDVCVCVIYLRFLLNG